MLLKQVKIGTKIKLELLANGSVYNFESEVVRHSEAGALVAPIEKDGAIINFNVRGVMLKACVTDSENGKVYEWSNIQVLIAKTRGGERFHHFLCERDVEPTNRRNRFRVWVGVDAVAQIGANNKTYDVIIKDISASGIGFVCRREIPIKLDETVHLTFFDEERGTNFNILATVIRCDEVDESRNVYGCKLKAENLLINKYVNEKQLKQLRGRAGQGLRMNERESSL